jgi:YfiH family protein
MKRIEKNGVVYFVFENLEATGIVRHGFSSRIGGVSRGHFAAMNLGYNRGDDDANVKENYRLLCNALGVDAKNIARGSQRHTINIQKADCAGNWEHTDGLVTNKPGITLVTYYADCVPLLLCDPVKGVIANCHAGWRGTAHNMAGAAVQKMKGEYGCDARDIIVGIGPSISCENFEVGADVAEIFKDLLPFCADFVYNSSSKPYKFHIDLWGINRASLTEAGVPKENIEISGMCTFDDETHFYSHRRSGKDRGSLAALIALEGES